MMLKVYLIVSHKLWKGRQYTWNTSCDYEVRGMILLHDIEGAMQFDHSKDISVYVSICTSYDLNTLMTVV